MKNLVQEFSFVTPKYIGVCECVLCMFVCSHTRPSVSCRKSLTVVLAAKGGTRTAQTGIAFRGQQFFSQLGLDHLFSVKKLNYYFKTPSYLLGLSLIIKSPC